ncbi:MAG: Holliday junction ATP-dependent DNA helicase RuvA [Syntrophus sp. SKADARSKE-3]|nr:Holliday junction ATP-dependent DNA helicase RuvA [Syntrophus sp. SKADARSKE-3]
MIARISGTLIYKSVQHLIVDTQGVGYRVVVPLTTFYEMPETGQTVTLHIHTQVKEDAISLYGFSSLEEREIFQVIISVSGIGPKLAVNILSGISAPELIAAIVQGDVKRLVAIPGIGRKMAERIVLELKDKMQKIVLDQSLPLPESGRQRIEALKEDALSALVNLGYKNAPAKEAIDRVIQDQPEEPATLDMILKGALKLLAG